MYIAAIIAIGVAAFALFYLLYRHVQKPGISLEACADDPPLRVKKQMNLPQDWPPPSALAPELKRRLRSSSPKIIHDDSEGYLLVRLHGHASLGSGLNDWMPHINVAVGFDGREAIVGADFAVGWWLNEEALEQTVVKQICNPLVQIGNELTSHGPEESTPADGEPSPPKRDPQ